MRRYVATWLCIVFLKLAMHAMLAQNITPRNAPENDLLARALGERATKGIRLAPLTQRVWSERELLKLADSLPASDADVLRRLLLGASVPHVSACNTIVLLTVENKPQLAWRVSGIHPLHPNADVVFAIDTIRSLYEQQPTMPWAHTVQLRFYTPIGEWRIGQAPLRWGGGYSGAMLLSDTAPPIPHLDYRQRWYLGRALGAWQYEQMAAVFEEANARRYLMARRLSRELSPHWELSLAEAFKASKLPEGLSALVLPFYLYQHIFSKPRFIGNDNWFNYMAEVQASYRFAHQRLYMSLLLDDIQAPRFLTKYRYTTPRKIGVLLGYHTPLPNNGQFAVELAHTDGAGKTGVYLFKNPQNNWRYRGVLLGHPVGTNRDMLWLRLDTQVFDHGYLALEYTNTRQAMASPEAPANKQWVVHLHWLIGSQSSVGVRWQQDITRDGNDTRWLLQAGTLF